MQHIVLLTRTLLSKSSQLYIVIMRMLACTHCRQVILETMTISVIISAQVFEAPSRPSQQHMPERAMTVSVIIFAQVFEAPSRPSHQHMPERAFQPCRSMVAFTFYGFWLESFAMNQGSELEVFWSHRSF